LSPSARAIDIIGRVLHYEAGGDDNGGWHHDPADPGGSTQWGISARYNPNVARLIEEGKLSRDHAIAIAYRKYYAPLPLLDRMDPEMAFIVFDSHFHGGADERATIRTIQYVLCIVDKRSLKIDGKYGPQTARFLVNASPEAITQIKSMLRQLAPSIAAKAAAAVEKSQKSRNLASANYTRGFENRILWRLS
jgi:lysozyme family protein